ncbi:MAG: NnrS family protein [Gallionellales bacterium CG03_land_8_20_14_0_80_55_15]|nr:MAG: NnrS family protein [Gallionellales bacterium CG03_land_8_20_14_0_80_55_15]PJC04667.1 MAG: NnrS family protein [Gallionellales bacterium CG_4_9_14_0_8_um_filter_55_61]
MKLSSYPFWLLGFRPFFSLAILAGAVLPMLWALVYAGLIPAPATTFSSVQWHAHEMFFGFGWAVLGGFLLTASRSWVKVRGYHGQTLMWLVAAWLFERAGMWCEGDWPALLFRISNNLFLVVIVVMVMRTLQQNRERDFYRDNYFFLLILPMFLLAKNLLLNAEYFQQGALMSVGLFRLAFLVMLERTLSQFMKFSFQVEILEHPALNKAIKFSCLLLVFGGFMPNALTAGIALLAALLLGLRLVFWYPHKALRRLDIGIMYLGYLAITVQLLIEFLRLTLYPQWSVSLSMHVFTFGAMGLIIPAMLIRITRGHTGRPVVFDRRDKRVLWGMMAAFVFRLIAPLFDPADYTRWILLAALCWLASFTLLAWRYLPFLFQARVDGKEY